MVTLPFQPSAPRALLARYASAEALLKKRGPDPNALELDGSVLSYALYKGAAGIREVETHHKALFASDQGADLLALERYEAAAHEEHAALQREQDADDVALKKTDPTKPAKPEDGTGIPWSGWDIAQAAFYFSMTVTLLCVGIRGMGLALVQSGLEIFDEEETFNLFFFSFVLVGLTAVLKGSWSLARTDAGRHNVAWIILMVGVIAGVLWGWEFAGAFGGGFSTELPPITVGTPEFGTHESGAHGGKLLTWLGIIAEAFLGATCWIQGAMLMVKHRPIREIPNEKAVTIAERIDARKPALGYLKDLEARLAARSEAIRQASTVFVKRAVAKLKTAARTAERSLRASEELEALSHAPATAAGTNGRDATSNGEAALDHRERLLVAASRNGSAGAAEDDPQAQAPEDGDTGTTDNPDSEETSE